MKNKIITFIVTMVLSLSFAFSACAATKYVTAPSGLNVREQPDGQIVTALPYGSSIEITEELGQWSKALIDGREVYIASYYLRDDKPVSNVSFGGRSLGTFKLTGYCTCYKCTGKNSPEYTGRPSRTATGTTPTMNRTISVDPDVIPLGTWVEINLPGVGWQRFHAEDTGGKWVQGNHIDIYAGSHSNAYSAKYNGYAEVRLVN